MGSMGKRTLRAVGIHHRSFASRRRHQGFIPLCKGAVSYTHLLEGELVDVRVPALESRTAGRKPVHLELGRVQRMLGTTIDPEGITEATVEKVLSLSLIHI